MYRYHQVFAHPDGGRTMTRRGVLAAVQLLPWADGIIRPTEAAAPAAVEAELGLIKATAAHASPVLAGYRDAAGEIARLCRAADGDRPVVEVKTADGTLHRVMRIGSAETIGQLRHAFAPKKLLVLDGHARYEAMLAYQAQIAQATSLLMYASPNFGLMCLIDLEDPALSVAPRHLVLRGEGLTSAAFLAAARRWFIVEPLAGAGRDVVRAQRALAETVAHQPAMVVAFAGEKDAWKLTLSPDVSPTNEGVPIHRALAKFEPVVAYQLLLERGLPAGAVTSHQAIVDPAAALAQLDTGGAQVAVIMRPLAIDQISQVAELGQVLPAGSTAFAPMLAHRLVTLAINADEDLV
jgi:uncharacterized protein (DUF1015 family)